MKIGCLIVSKDSGVNDKTKNEWYKVKLVCVISPNMPLLVGLPLDKYVDKEIYDSFVVAPTEIVELDIDLRQAYNPQYADLHLNINFVDSAN